MIVLLYPGLHERPAGTDGEWDPARLGLQYPGYCRVRVVILHRVDLAVQRERAYRAGVHARVDGVVIGRGPEIEAVRRV